MAISSTFQTCTTPPSLILLLRGVGQYPWLDEDPDFANKSATWQTSSRIQMKHQSADRWLFSWSLLPTRGRTVECSLPACSFHQNLPAPVPSLIIFAHVLHVFESQVTINCVMTWAGVCRGDLPSFRSLMTSVSSMVSIKHLLGLPCHLKGSSLDRFEFVPSSRFQQFQNISTM